MNEKCGCDVSIIVPMYNESDVIDSFFTEIKKVMDSLSNYSYEIICVDDGSNDNTLDILKKYSLTDNRIKIISFSRNFQKEAAMLAGLNYCSGKCAIPIDADLQDPPELIEKFLEKWKEGYDNVYGIRINRNTDSFLKKLTSRLFYSIFNKISDKKIPSNAGDYRLIDRKVIDNINRLNEASLFMKGIFNWVGFRSYGIEYIRPKRIQGKTKWNYWKLWNFALDGITSFTTLPIRIWTYIGFILEIFAFTYIIYSMSSTNIFSITNFIILFLFGLQFIAIGTLGEYIGRIFIETKNRPLYIIKEKVNL